MDPCTTSHDSNLRRTTKKIANQKYISGTVTIHTSASPEHHEPCLSDVPSIKGFERNTKFYFGCCHERRKRFSCSSNTLENIQSDFSKALNIRGVMKLEALLRGMSQDKNHKGCFSLRFHTLLGLGMSKFNMWARAVKELKTLSSAKLLMHKSTQIH